MYPIGIFPCSCPTFLDRTKNCNFYPCPTFFMGWGKKCSYYPVNICLSPTFLDETKNAVLILLTSVPIPPFRRRQKTQFLSCDICPYPTFLYETKNCNICPTKIIPNHIHNPTFLNGKKILQIFYPIDISPNNHNHGLITVQNSTPLQISCLPVHSWKHFSL